MPLHFGRLLHASFASPSLLLLCMVACIAGLFVPVQKVHALDQTRIEYTLEALGNRAHVRGGLVVHRLEDCQSATANYKNKKLLVSYESATNRCWVWLPIALTYRQPNISMDLLHTDTRKKEHKTSPSFDIQPKAYKESRITVAPRFVDPLPPELLKQVLQDRDEMMAQYQIYSKIPPSFSFVMPTKKTRVSSNFGFQRFYNGEPRAAHSGVDLALKVGVPIMSIADGVVVYSKNYYYSGESVIVDHGGGLMSVYFHLDTRSVQKGDVVTAGQHIGTNGATGRVTGPHLHLSIQLQGVRINPLLLLPEIQSWQGAESPLSDVL